MISRWVIYFSLTFTILNSALGSEFGEGCVTLPVDSCNSTAFLKCNVLGPSGSTCGCDTEIAVENPNEKGTCIKLPDKLGQDCQILNGTFEMCSKIDGAMCNGTICVCSDLYFEAGAQCHKYTEALFGNCNISLTGQCDKILEENGAHCDPIYSKCLCNAGTHLESLSRQKCLKYRQNIGDPCEAVFGSENLCARISGGGAICNTVNSTCTCDVLNNYFLHPNGTHCLKYADALNATCEVGTEMCAQIEGAECNTVTGKCNCDPDHATDMTDVKCVPFINNVGGNCSQSTIPDQCSKIDGAECNTNNSTCLCDSSHFPISSLCHPLATKPNDLCLMNEHCIGVEHTICIGSECTCDPYNGWEPSNEGTCVKLAENVNEVCTTPQGCRQIPGTQCLNSTCQCLPNYVESTTGKLCLIAVDKLGATCSETPQCRMGIGNNSLCISAAGCGCESGYVGEVVDGGKDRCSLEQGQYFKIWSIQGCEGEADVTQTSTSNVTVGVLNPTIYYRVNGLWSSETCTAANCTGRQIRSGTSGYGCNALAIPLNSINVRVTMFGDVNQNKTTIHFFSATNLLGSETIVTEAGSNQLTIIARSYYFEGPHSWDINNGADCLNHTSTVSQNRFGITYNGNVNLSPQIVKFGCMDVITTTTPAPTTCPPIDSIQPTRNSEIAIPSSGFQYWLNNTEAVTGENINKTNVQNLVEGFHKLNHNEQRSFLITIQQE